MKRTVLALALGASALLLAGCGSSTSPTTPEGPLTTEDVVVGTGPTAAAGDTIQVHYVGTFDSGVQFDSSIARGTPFTFRLGAGAVIPGWDRGIPGMRVGGTRRLVIPPSLAYGSTGNPPVIPPNATLHFDVQLLAIAGK